jgi:hypothetical protein
MSLDLDYLPAVAFRELPEQREARFGLARKYREGLPHAILADPLGQLRQRGAVKGDLHSR